VLEVRHASRPGSYEPAEFISVTPGQPALLPLLVRRYDGGESPLELATDTPVEGVRFENSQVGPGQAVVELKMRIDKTFKMGRFRMKTGSAVTPPITLIPEMSEEAGK
jgi:hypothetical protein